MITPGEFLWVVVAVMVMVALFDEPHGGARA